MTDQQKHSIGHALGRVPSGVFILTAKHQTQVAAMMASWVMQASFTPPTITIAVATGRPILQLIEASGRLALSILPQDDKTLMKHYARFKGGEDPFAGVSTQPAPSGVPVLSDALGYLDCKVTGVHTFGGDHDLIIAEITDGAMLREGAAFTHQRGNGFHY